jgi:Flp pilus assembly protein TadD
LTAAAYDWVWQLPAVALVALLLGAGILSSHGSTLGGRPSWAVRVLVATAGIGAMIAIAIPFGETVAIRSSQADAASGRLDAALGDATTAQRLEPYAATPRVQQALILERAGDLRGARAAIIQATARAATNWSIWLVRARIDAESGRERAAASDYRRAHALDPLSPTTALGG